MRDLIIRNLDEAIVVELKRKAWYQGLPLEAFLRRLLIASIDDENESVEPAPFLAHAPSGGADPRPTAGCTFKPRAERSPARSVRRLRARAFLKSAII